MSDRPEREIARLLKRMGLTIATAESATGGLLASMITDVPGSSDYFKGSVVAYAGDVKEGVLGVRRVTLESYGAVSSQTCGEMAEGVRRLMEADIGLSDTGIAGPGGAAPGKEVGLFYIGLSSEHRTLTRGYLFRGGRLENKQAAAGAALEMLKSYLLEAEEGSRVD